MNCTRGFIRLEVVDHLTSVILINYKKLMLMLKKYYSIHLLHEADYISKQTKGFSRHDIDLNIDKEL